MRGKRVRIPGQHEMGLEDFEIDERMLRDSEILMKTHYTLISPGTELAIIDRSRARQATRAGQWASEMLL